LLRRAEQQPSRLGDDRLVPVPYFDCLLVVVGCLPVRAAVQHWAQKEREKRELRTGFRD